MTASPLVVLPSLADWTGAAAGLEVVDARQFLARDTPLPASRAVLNLCPDAGYLSEAWYVSLLAEARGARPYPRPSRSGQAADPLARDRLLRLQNIDVLDARELSDRILRWAADGAVVPGQIPVSLDPDEPGLRAARAEEQAEVRVFCGEPSGTPGPVPTALLQRVFAALEWPAMTVRLVFDAGRWRLLDVRPLEWAGLSTDERHQLLSAAHHLDPVGRSAATSGKSLAILWDPLDASSASTSETLDRLAIIGEREGLRVERIGPPDLDRLGDHDALFIRTLTGVDQPAWAFAARAEALGMPVMDHPEAIVRCSNKVYAFELLRRHGVPVPPTVVFGATDTFDDLVEELGAPVVVKVPDGSFSTGVFRIASAADFEARIPPLFERSPLLVGQAYMPTSFDWRVGVLDGKALYIARYHMVPGHWQIRTLDDTAVRFGRVEAVSLADAPEDVLSVAVSAARLFGDGLFGVDLKETEDGVVVIEVNDNPNLDLGYEDAAEGDAIYTALVRWFLDRLHHSPAREAEKKPRRRRRERPTLDATLEALRRPIGRIVPQKREYHAFEVTGLELEYPIVDRDLNVQSLAEPLLARFHGRPCSDVSLGRVGMSNELFDHVIELKNEAPLRSLKQVEEDLVEGVRRVSFMLDRTYRARLLPGGMHPWFRPDNAVIWRRSGRRIYDTYARLFELNTHGWANVQAVHVNLPMGSPEEATAMLNAARLLVPYLPALSASSPLVEGELTGRLDNRVSWLLEHQSRLPESMARLVPEPLDHYDHYKRDILAPMYAAVDRLPDASALRHPFLNARGAVFKPSRTSMEVRILDVQECVAMDVAMAWFVRRALQALIRLAIPADSVSQAALEADLVATARSGRVARVQAPFVPASFARAADGTVSAEAVLRWLFDLSDRRVPGEEVVFRDRIAFLLDHGSLSERVVGVLAPLAEAVEQGTATERDFTERARSIWLQLAECLVENRPWSAV